MLTVWTKHLQSVDERADFNRYLKSSKPVFERLFDILKEQEQRTDDLETSVKSFDNPNWAYKQAYRNGFKEAIKQLKILIDPDQWREAHE